MKGDGNVSGNEDKGSVDHKECVKDPDSHSGIDKKMSENEQSSVREKDSGNDEHDVHSAHSAYSENVEITDKEKDEVNSEGNVSGDEDKGLLDDKESVKGCDSHSGLEGNISEIKKESESDIVEVSSETVNSKVVGEITSMEPDSDIETHRDTSADESGKEQISHSRTLTDSDKEDVGQNEWKKKLTKVRVKLEPQDLSYEMLNVQIKNEDDQSNDMRSMSTSYGETKEEDVQNTKWYRVATQSQGGNDRGT